MSDRMRYILVGATAIAGLVALAVLLSLFGYVPSLLESGYTVHVQMPDAGGLSEGSRVRYNGLDVGRVASIELAEPSYKGVEVELLIREEFRVPRDVDASVRSGLIGGSPYLSLDTSHLDPTQPHEMLATDGSAVINAEASDLLVDVDARFREAVHEFERLVDAFEGLSAEWTLVGANINDLTAPRRPSDVDAGASPANLSTVLARTDERLREMETALAGINAWVNDEKLREDFQLTASNLREMSGDLKSAAADAKAFTGEVKGRFNQSADKVDALLDTAKQDVDQLTKRYIAVADDLSRTLMAMQQTVDKARTGDGTVGKLLNDPSLYNNLDDSAKRLGAALIELKLLIRKLEKEGLLGL